jgi:metal-responsive CopG/Arc/MetJ family transcriptional regulator
MKSNNQENINKQMHILIQQSLYNEFVEKCTKNYKTTSQTIRDLIVNYLKEGK